MYRLCFIVFGITAVVAVPKDPQRIVGGELTTINAYPFQAGLLYSQNLASYWQSCAGSILTTTTVLTAAHCVHGDSISRWRIRVGATFANSGGAVHSPHNIIPHPSYVPWMSSDNDVALIKVASPFVYIPNTVAPASIAGTNYHVADDQVVWAVGWGTTSFGGPSSEQLRHVQVWTINQDICRTRYEELRYVVTENMLCSGWLDVGGRDQCQGDSGGPLIHSNVVVGVSSWGHQCALARYPGVNARVSSYSTWIQANA